jgi:hypothetical protein
MRPGATPSRPTPSRSIRRPISAARGAPADGSSSVSAERRAELDAWDTFCYVHLEDHELKALEELREDSWLGGEWE